MTQVLKVVDYFNILLIVVMQNEKCKMKKAKCKKQNAK